MTLILSFASAANAACSYGNRYEPSLRPFPDYADWQSLLLARQIYKAPVHVFPTKATKGHRLLSARCLRCQRRFSNMVTRHHFVRQVFMNKPTVSEKRIWEASVNQDQREVGGKLDSRSDSSTATKENFEHSVSISVLSSASAHVRTDIYDVQLKNRLYGLRALRRLRSFVPAEQRVTSLNDSSKPVFHVFIKGWPNI